MLVFQLHVSSFYQSKSGISSNMAVNFFPIKGLKADADDTTASIR